jgi:hypothetical protein
MARRLPLSVRIAKAKKTKPREHLIRWRVSLIKGTPAKFIDFAYAPMFLSYTPMSAPALSKFDRIPVRVMNPH